VNDPRKSTALLLALLAVAMFTVFGLALVERSVNEGGLSRRGAESAQAFWLAEAGLNRAVVELKANYGLSGAGLFNTTSGSGRYSADIVQNGTRRIVTGHGFVPAVSARVTRAVTGIIDQLNPPNFFANAIYSAGDVDINGNSYSINGTVLYAGNISGNTSNINPGATQNTTIAPLVRFDFVSLRDIAVSQNNYYDSARLKKVETNKENYPTDFWNDPPTNSTPNVIYIDGDLVLNGEINEPYGAVGGFYVVVGDVINSPDAVENATINGHGQINGAIYTMGEFRVNGGGGALNINGGVWAGQEARLNGNTNIAHNNTYMNAISNMNLTGVPQLIAWEDSERPYRIVP